MELFGKPMHEHIDTYNLAIHENPKSVEAMANDYYLGESSMKEFMEKYGKTELTLAIVALR